MRIQSLIILSQDQQILMGEGVSEKGSSGRGGGGVVKSLHTYSQLELSPIIRTAVTSPAKIYHRRLTEINSRYYGLSLLRPLLAVPRVSTIKGVDCTLKGGLRAGWEGDEVRLAPG